MILWIGHLHFGYVIGSETYEADYVIVSVPLGVLKAGSITFDPPLTQAKQNAIQAAGKYLSMHLDLAFRKHRTIVLQF